MKAPFDIQLLTDDKIVKESSSYKLTLTWMNQNGKEMVKQYDSAQLRQGQGQQSFSPTGTGDNILSQIPEATTTTDISFGAKALQFLTYCNNQFSQTPVSSMTTATLVFCTMVYDWYLNGCNNTIIAPIIEAQCKDPIIIQQVNNYKTQIEIRIQQIIKIEIPSPRDGGGGNGKHHGLTISISFAKNPIVRGNTQTITVIVSDAESNEKIQGAIVKASVKYASGKHTEELGSKTTDSSGQASFSWTIGGDSEPGTFIATVQASASDYESASKTRPFQVIAKNDDNTTLPIGNDTIFINDTTGVMPNDTGNIGNATEFSDVEGGGTGGDNGDNVTLPIPPDPCLENPSLPECTTATPQALISDPCIENPTAEGCEPPTPPPPPIVGEDIDTGDTGDTVTGGGDTGDGGDGGDTTGTGNTDNGGGDSSDDIGGSDAIGDSSSAGDAAK